MRGKETILPGRSLRIGTSDSEWIERSLPIPILPFAPEEPGTTVEYVDKILGTLDEGLIIIHMS